MPSSSDDAPRPASPPRPKRARSTRYPGVALGESLRLCESLDSLGLDGMTAPAIASALGYTNIKTNTFSARLSSARQFGLLNLAGDGYGLTPLARAILHPVDPAQIPALHRQAFLKPPLYADLAERLAGKRVPEVEILGNLLYHQFQIIATAKRSAAEAFLESARFAGVLGDDQVVRPEGAAAAIAPAGTDPPAPPRPRAASPRRSDPAEVRFDLELWDEDEGKRIRVRAPRSMTAASFERFLQALRLLVRIDGPGSAGSSGRG
jgi:hypothetical protein